MSSNKEIIDRAQAFVEKLAEIMTDFNVNLADDGGGTSVYINNSFIQFSGLVQQIYLFKSFVFTINEYITVV